MENNNAIEIFNRLASLYQEKYMDVSHYADTLKIFCTEVTAKDAAILELGCGPGNVTQFLLGARPDFKILATDLAPNMLQLTRQNNPSVETQILDCRDISNIPGTFDGIMCAFCFPYISKEEALKLIDDAVGLLSNGGTLYISTMEDAYVKSGYQTSSSGDKMYMYFHEGDYLVAGLEKNGMSIVGIKRQAFPPSGIQTATDLIIIAKKM